MRFSVDLINLLYFKLIVKMNLQVNMNNNVQQKTNIRYNVEKVSVRGFYQFGYNNTSDGSRGKNQIQEVINRY